MGQPNDTLDLSPAVERFKQAKAWNIFYEKQTNGNTSPFFFFFLKLVHGNHTAQ